MARRGCTYRLVTSFQGPSGECAPPNSTTYFSKAGNVVNIEGGAETISDSHGGGETLHALEKVGRTKH
jgi:hypothetical protein